MTVKNKYLSDEENISILTPPDENISNFFIFNNNLPIFSTLIKQFVDEFSKELLSNTKLKIYPDIVSLAFWMRKSNIVRLEKNFIRKCGGVVKVPVGNVIHFAPSNVDTIFIYSLFISLLLGNKNVVRVSSKQSVQRDILVDMLSSQLSKDKFSSLKNYLCIVSYPHSDKITKDLCSDIDLRVVWGGDDTVNKISSFSMKPTATEIKFANKYSVCLIDAESLSSFTDEVFNKNVIDFVNDSYWFGQQGCSSPRTVAWINSNGQQETIDRFWTAVSDRASLLFAKDIEPADIANKVVASCHISALVSQCDFIHQNEMLTRISLPKISVHNSVRELHCGSGLFIEVSLNHISELTSLVDRKVQTISYIGFCIDDLKCDFINHGIYPDRVVPAGKALDFSTLWDGYDLLQSMTRSIDFV
ncbi:acyl-CoA reductase [Vibrio sp. 1CM8B]|uniref:acyl-CoA reductase n=1 Tax=Vibrio sp. 1CM8B TaxID=2929167 RepID=UPI0020C08011|nr:acyl-CoA reductase [Vibrio sp. 1CM8B]MCK8087065.1 hypothetical protein [Vibrio sp. 1CM8B]